MLKGSSIYFNDHICDTTTALRKELFQQQKIHRDNGKFDKG